MSTELHHCDSISYIESWRLRQGPYSRQAVKLYQSGLSLVAVGAMLNVNAGTCSESSQKRPGTGRWIETGQVKFECAAPRIGGAQFERRETAGAEVIEVERELHRPVCGLEKQLEIREIRVQIDTDEADPIKLLRIGRFERSVG